MEGSREDVRGARETAGGTDEGGTKGKSRRVNVAARMLLFVVS